MFFNRFIKVFWQYLKEPTKLTATFLPKGEKRVKRTTAYYLVNLMSSVKYCRKVKTFSEKYPRGIFKDRRDDGGGAFFATPPYTITPQYDYVFCTTFL
nr:MAG: hypothetical protein [Bacteriophage sp.]